ncbi:MAG: hypothetical protein NTZ90_10765 [Proteobacteria bacterium]|nr:hypothetical protein [Pseudomonadota bacterium]
MAAAWDIYWPKSGTKFLMDQSGRDHMMLVVGDPYRFGGYPFFPFIPISHTRAANYCVALAEADVAPTQGSLGVSNSSHALCGLIFTARGDQFGTLVGKLTNKAKKDDILEALSNRLGLL